MEALTIEENPIEDTANMFPVVLTNGGIPGKHKNASMFFVVELTEDNQLSSVYSATSKMKNDLSAGERIFHVPPKFREWLTEKGVDSTFYIEYDEQLNKFMFLGNEEVDFLKYI